MQLVLQATSLNKTCVNCYSKIDKTKILKTNGSLMKVRSIAECHFRQVLLYTEINMFFFVCFFFFGGGGGGVRLLEHDGKIMMVNKVLSANYKCNYSKKYIKTKVEPLHVKEAQIDKLQPANIHDT